MTSITRNSPVYDYDALYKSIDLSLCHAICRLCLRTDEVMDDLFYMEESFALLDKLFQCTSIKIAPAECITSSICDRCKAKLIDLHKFREQCLRCEEIFISKVGQIEKETIEVVPDIFDITSEDENTDQVFNDPDEKATKEFDDWKGIDIEDAMGVNGGTFLIKATNSPPDSGSESLNELVNTNSQNYTLTPPDNIDLKALVVYVTGKKHWKCPYCEKYFNQTGNLKSHINTHTGYKPYACNLCHRSFAQKSNLNYHIRTSHDPQRPFKCNACDKSFTSMDGMVLHLKSKHKPSEGLQRSAPPKKHACPYCEKTFAQSFNLKLHINAHTGERPYKCDICPKSFTQRSNLNVHINKKHKQQKV